MFGFRERSTRSHGVGFRRVLGGSWVVISWVVSPLIWVISIATLLITLLITTHEPPSRVWDLRFGSACRVELRVCGGVLLVKFRVWRVFTLNPKP